MRITLEVTRSDTDVLTGAVQWKGCRTPVQFHGTLELLAILETASDHSTIAELDCGG